MEEPKHVKLTDYIDSHPVGAQRYVCACLGVTAGFVSHQKSNHKVGKPEMYLKVESDGFISGHYFYREHTPPDRERLAFIRQWLRKLRGDSD